MQNVRDAERDCRFSLDQIRREAIGLLESSKLMQSERFGVYTAGVVDLVRRLEELTENFELDKNGGEGE